MDSMDFHSLSRRELQCLCKKNKIPANMTNIAMADALTALTNVIGIEEIGQSESTMPETPLTSRRTTVRKTATKPPAVESESTTQTLTRPRRATTTKKIIKEEDPMDLSEITTSVNETPAPRTGRRRVASGTSVCRKLDAQTQEVKEESKEERPVVHSYSTRRSSRLQSGQKISESVQKIGGRKTDAVMIGVLSEEETDDVPMKSNSDAIDVVQENQGTNVMVLSPIPDDATQEDVISEDGSSSTLVSANVSSCFEEVSSANEDLISMSKDEFSVEQSSEQQDMSTEVSSCMNDVNVSEICVSELTHISEIKVEITSEDQDMLFEDSNVASDDLDNMEIKEEPAVEVTVKSPDVSSQKTAQMPVASPLEEKTNALVKQVDDMRKCIEDQNAEEYGMTFSFEDDFSDSEPEVLKSSFDFEDMKETMEDISNLERSIQVENRVVSSLECEKLDGVEMQEYQASDLPGLNLTDATVFSPVEVASKGNQVKSNDSVSIEQLENQKVDSVKCDSIANEVGVKVDASTDEEGSDKDSVKCDSIANEGVKVDSLLGDASTDEEDSDNESDEDESVDDESDEDEDEDDETVGDDDDDETVGDDESNDNVDEIHGSPVAGHLKIQNPVTPLKSSSAKKTATPKSKIMIKVLEDTEESNKSGKVALKSNSKLQTPGVAEEKENSDNNKGESTAQKVLKGKSLRQLKKIMKERRLVMKMLKEMKISSDNKETMGKENLQVEKRMPLQKLSDNCRLGEEQK